MRSSEDVKVVALGKEPWGKEDGAIGGLGTSWREADGQAAYLTTGYGLQMGENDLVVSRWLVSTVSSPCSEGPANLSTIESLTDGLLLQGAKVSLRDRIQDGR